MRTSISAVSSEGFNVRRCGVDRTIGGLEQASAMRRRWRREEAQ